MSISLSRDDENKIINMNEDSRDEASIKFQRNNHEEESFDFFKEEKPEEENFGLNFIANENKRISDSEKSFSDDEHGSEASSENIFMKDNLEDGKEEINSYQELSYEEIQQQKAYYLSQLKRLEAKGHFASRRLSMEHSLNDIKNEVVKIRKEIEVDRGVNYCRQGLMFCVSTIEMLNNKYDPFGVELDGWSNVIMADKESYDDVFEELYEKYSSKMAMAPEIKLISMIAGSAMMFHLQKSLMSKHFTPKTNFTPERQASQKMRGPSVDSEELLRKLNSDDFSDASSVISDSFSDVEKSSKVISIPQPKKRGRKPKIGK